MTILTAFPDAEAALCDLLVGGEDSVDYGAGDFGTGQFGGAGITLNVGTVTPPNLLEVLQFARVHVFTGADDRFTDTSRATIDNFALTRADAKETAEQIRQLFTQGPVLINGIVLDSITTDTKPVEVPWSPDVRRYTATYRIAARR